VGADLPDAASITGGPPPPASGLTDPVGQTAQVFRALLSAMAQPARACNIGLDLARVGGAHPASLAILLTLADFDTPVCLVGSAVSELGSFLRFHCGCPVTERPKNAALGLISEPMLACRAFEFPIGTEEYPDTSATVILEVSSLVAGPRRTIKGPGIRASVEFAPAVHAEFWSAWHTNTQLYPRGIDVIFTCANEIAALPRSSRLEGS
jgi:alpha-D-ribose 1-methylphosphonate 5-triphosphate synthase subunit PhnH